MCRNGLLPEEETEMFRVIFERFMRVEFKMVVSMMGKLKKKEKMVYIKTGSRFLRQFLRKV